MRISHQFLIGLTVLIGLFALSFADVLIQQRSSNQQIETMASLVRDLELTDLSLFTEARYTRHLTQSDRHTAFQDHPFSFEHFPTGSLVLPLHEIK